MKNKNVLLDYSVLILLEDLSDGFADYVNRLNSAFQHRSDSFEIIIIANGTGAYMSSQIRLIKPSLNSIRAFCLNNKTTQAVCLKAGMVESRGRKIVACGSYQQITEDSFFRLIDSLNNEIDIACPRRQQRVDPMFNQVQSRFFNWFVRHFLDCQFNDLSSNVRVFHRHVLEDINLYGNMYRFLPILAKEKGFKTLEVDCEHFQERGKTGIYPLSEYVVRVIDILTVYFNTKFIRKPLRFFMRLGTLFIAGSMLIAFFITIQKIFFGIPLGDRPALLLTVFLLTMGAQITSVGLLGEIISFTLGRKKNVYRISKTMNMQDD